MGLRFDPRPDFTTRLNKGAISDLPEMSLGNVIFKLSSLPVMKMANQSEYRYNRIETIKGKTFTQHLGRGVETIDIQGTILSQLVGERDKGILSLKRAAEKGESLSLLDSTGAVHGQWVIVSLTVDSGEILAKGGKVGPQKIDFSVRLQRVEDEVYP